MKKATFTVLAASVLLIAQPSMAATKTENQQAATVVSTITVGALLAGPIGALTGVFAGEWLADNIGEAAEKQQLEGDITQLESELVRVTEHLNKSKQHLSKAKRQQALLAQQILDTIQLETFFDTGEANMRTDSQEKLQFLSRYLQNNPQLMIQLDGYADPRGSNEENLALSRTRVEKVYNTLLGAGVPSEQISQNYHGEASEQQHLPYALQRVVRVSVTNGTKDGELASR